MSSVPSQGTLLEVQNSAGAYIAVGNVRECSGIGGGEAPVIDTSNLQSTRAEKSVGLPDEGKVSLSCLWDPANAGQDRMAALRAARTLGHFRVTYADDGAEVESFDGYVLSAGKSVGVNDVVKVTYTIEITGEVTVS